MTISIELSNLGPLRSAKLDLADLTLLVGKNNTGKTFFATLLHRVLRTSPPTPAPFYRVPAETPQKVHEWVIDALENRNPDNPEIRTFVSTLDRESITWAQTLAGTALTEFAKDVRDAIAYAFSTDVSHLRRRTKSAHTADCHLTVRSHEPAWEINIRFDSDDIAVSPPDIEEWLVRLLDPIELRKASRRYTRVMDRRSSNYDELDRLSAATTTSRAFSDLFSSWPRNAVHLPADRTGIMQSQNILAGALASRVALAGIQPIESETFSGTSADFLQLILRISDVMMHRPDEAQSAFASLVSEFESNLRAEIQVDQKADGVNAIVAQTPEGQFPMSRTSSMLSELAPLMLILKAPFPIANHITIDEPEAHLHPDMQVQLASFLAALVAFDIRLVLTTHSEFFISQFNNMMRVHELNQLENSKNRHDLPSIDPAKVSMLHFTRKNRFCITQQISPKPVDGIEEEIFTDVIRSQYNMTSHLINDLLESQ